MTNRRERRLAFTLMEVMVAAGLLAIALLATMAAIGMGGQLRMTSGETETVSELISSLEERFQGEGRGNDWQERVLRLALDPMETGTLGDGSFTGALPGLTGQVVVLDELEASAAFAVDKDGTAGADPIDLDADSIANEVGLTWSTPGAFSPPSLPAPGTHLWNASKGTNDSNVRGMRVIPIRITVSWDTATGGGAAGQRRTMSAVTIVYPKSN